MVWHKDIFLRIWLKLSTLRPSVVERHWCLPNHTRVHQIFRSSSKLELSADLLHHLPSQLNCFHINTFPPSQHNKTIAIAVLSTPLFSFLIHSVHLDNFKVLYKTTFTVGCNAFSNKWSSLPMISYLCAQDLELLWLPLLLLRWQHF